MANCVAGRRELPPGWSDGLPPPMVVVMALTALRSLFAPKRAPAAVPVGQRVYAIGDIHGRLDLFDELVGRIDIDRARARPVVVLLGDYVDRGLGSAELLERLSSGGLPDWADWVCLRGNHEQAMLDALEPEADKALVRWREFGGRDTMRSYGVPSPLSFGDDMPGLRADLLTRIPPRHLDWLRSLPLSHRIGDYLFVHAGIRPKVALTDQDPFDLLWIREEFLTSRVNHGVMVVHGHSIELAADERSNRIGIDTGAYKTGVLTALALDGTARRFLQTMPEA